MESEIIMLTSAVVIVLIIFILTLKLKSYNNKTNEAIEKYQAYGVIPPKYTLNRDEYDIDETTITTPFTRKTTKKD